MQRWRAWVQLSTVVLALLPTLGGCPATSAIGAPDGSLSADSITNAAASGDSQSSLPAPAAPASAAGNISTTGDEDFSAALAAKFPSCGLPASAASWRDQILALVNQERSNAGLAQVARNATLEDQAEEYACEMIAQNFFAHENPVTGSTLKDRAASFDYQFMVIGENLAAGQQTPQEVMTAWMNSPGHRANILDSRFTELGVSVRIGGQYGIYWVQEFGKPLN